MKKESEGNEIEKEGGNVFISKQLLREMNKNISDLRCRLKILERKISAQDNQDQGQNIDKGMHEINLYANNEMYLKELRICISAHDWCLLKSQPCYQELVEFVRNLETQENRESLDHQRD